jgi:hypothetical protein
VSPGTLTAQLRIEVRICSKDSKHDTGGRSVVARTNDVAVPDDDNQLTLVVVLELGERANGMTQRNLSFRVIRNLANHELVVILGAPKLIQAMDLNAMMLAVITDDARRMYCENKH